MDHGTYPFVTSSSSTAGGACTGTGVPPTRIDGAIGVLKAYSTRVGGGPFTAELHGDTAEFLRQRGNEYGTTTGRPRRCGWLDTVVARYAQLLNGVDAIALTKLDVLDELRRDPGLYVAYRLKGETVRDLPPDQWSLENAEPVLKTMKGWKKSTVGTLEQEDLPQEARDYVDFIEQEIGAPISLTSTGPRREETILRDHPRPRPPDRRSAGGGARPALGREGGGRSDCTLGCSRCTRGRNDCTARNRFTQEPPGTGSPGTGSRNRFHPKK